MSAASWPSTEDRPRRAYSRDALDRVEALIARAAAAGACCPTNREIATALGIAEDAAKVYVRRLAAQGRVRIITGGKTAVRVVEIVATGATTATAGPKLALLVAPAPATSPRHLPVRRAVADAGAAAEPAPRRGAPLRGLPPAVRYACESVERVPPHQDLRAHGCGWIEGDLPSGGWHYCNRPARPGTAWCPEHYGRCYTPRPVPGAA